MKRIHATIMTALVAVLATAACDVTAAKKPVAGSGGLTAVPSGPLSVTPTTGTPTGSAAPVCDTTPWRIAPISVHHDVTVPPVPVVTGIRAGSHPDCRYDRLVLDLGGVAPGYRVRYVSAVTADGSGDPVTVPGGGAKHVLITLNPAQAHTGSGAATIERASRALGYPMLKGYAVTGDYEGYVTVALGLAGTARVRTGELSGRLYLDVAY